MVLWHFLKGRCVWRLGLEARGLTNCHSSPAIDECIRPSPIDRKIVALRKNSKHLCGVVGLQL